MRSFRSALHRDPAVNLGNAVDLLWFHRWWQYPQPGDPWFSIPYHVFNLFEGACWVVIAVLVARRHRMSRRSPWEVVYALAFLTFGLTDFREAYALESWLVWVKLVNLVVLVRLRNLAVRRWYPRSKLF
jgi:hypothetical protein